MLLGMLKQMWWRRLSPRLATVDTPMPPEDEPVPSTIRVDPAPNYIPDTTPADGWRQLAECRAYQAAWMRRKAQRFGATTRAEAREQAILDIGDRPPPGVD